MGIGLKLSRQRQGTIYAKPLKQNTEILGLPGGPVVKTALPVQGGPVQSLVRELDPTRHTKRSRVPQLRPSTVK